LSSITLSLLGISQVYLDSYQRPAKDLAFFLQQYLTANSDRLSHFGHRMSLFLQISVFRGICSVSRGIAKNVGDAMTLWPTGRTRGEEANEIEIGNFNTP
jgi:hypothetical protein